MTAVQATAAYTINQCSTCSAFHKMANDQKARKDNGIAQRISNFTRMSGSEKVIGYVWYLN